MNEKAVKAFVSSNNREYETPQVLFDELHALHRFTVDACASESNTKCDWWYSQSDSLLDLELGALKGERVFMNPPYGNPERPCVLERCKKKICQERGHHISRYIPGVYDFVQRAFLESALGSLWVCILPARTDTRWFHQFCWDRDVCDTREGICVDFLDQRIRFELGGEPENQPLFPSIIVTMKPYHEG